MKKFICILLTAIFLAGCADPQVIGGVKYETYGFFNESDVRNDGVKYSVSWGNVFWGVILFETIIAPIYFFGFSVMEPECKKPAEKGTVC